MGLREPYLACKAPAPKGGTKVVYSFYFQGLFIIKDI